MFIKACSQLLSLRTAKTSLQTMGRREPYVQGNAAPARDGATRAIPLREHNLGAVTDTVQSPSDRFHRWLSNFTDMITEYTNHPLAHRS